MNQEVCKNNHITAFPTIITYRNHKDHSHEHYHGDRTVGAFTSHVDAVWADQVKKGEAHALEAPKPEAPKEAQTPEAAGPTKGTFARAEGCQISGFLDVNKVGGTLHADCAGMQRCGGCGQRVSPCGEMCVVWLCRWLCVAVCGCVCVAVWLCVAVWAVLWRGAGSRKSVLHSRVGWPLV